VPYIIKILCELWLRKNKNINSTFATRYLQKKKKTKYNIAYLCSETGSSIGLRTARSNCIHFALNNGERDGSSDSVDATASMSFKWTYVKSMHKSWNQAPSNRLFHRLYGTRLFKEYAQNVIESTRRQVNFALPR